MPSLRILSGAHPLYHSHPFLRQAWQGRSHWRLRACSPLLGFRDLPASTAGSSRGWLDAVQHSIQERTCIIISLLRAPTTWQAGNMGSAELASSRHTRNFMNTVHCENSAQPETSSPSGHFQNPWTGASPQHRTEIESHPSISERAASSADYSPWRSLGHRCTERVLHLLLTVQVCYHSLNALHGLLQQSHACCQPSFAS